MNSIELKTQDGRAASIAKAKEQSTVHFLDTWTDASGKKLPGLPTLDIQPVSAQLRIKPNGSGGENQNVMLRFKRSGIRASIPLAFLQECNLLVPKEEGSDEPVLISDELGFKIEADGKKVMYA